MWQKSMGVPDFRQTFAGRRMRMRSPSSAVALRIVEVPDHAIVAAMRAFYTGTRQIAEGAGANGLAAILQERRVGVILSGGKVDRETFHKVFTDLE